MANIIRNEILQKKGKFKQTLKLPKGSIYLSSQLSARGHINIFHLAPELPTEKTETETRGFITVRTGTELPDGIFDCQHLASLGIAHIFEVPSHLAKEFQDLKTGLEEVGE